MNVLGLKLHFLIINLCNIFGFDLQYSFFDFHSYIIYANRSSKITSLCIIPECEF